MLKLTYTDTGFHLELIAQSLEDWVTARVILALRVGQPICVEPSTASFLLPADLPGLRRLEVETRYDSEFIDLSECDAEYLEVSLHGTWLSGDPDSEEGVFVAAMSDRAEFFLYKLWQDAQACTSSIR